MKLGGGQIEATETPGLHQKGASALPLSPLFAYLPSGRCPGREMLLPRAPHRARGSGELSRAETLSVCQEGIHPCSWTHWSHPHRFPIANLGILACPLEAAPCILDGGNQNDTSTKKREDELMEKCQHI